MYSLIMSVPFNIFKENTQNQTSIPTLFTTRLKVSYTPYRVTYMDYGSDPVAH